MIRATDLDRLNTLGLHSASLVRLLLAEADLLDEDRIAAMTVSTAARFVAAVEHPDLAGDTS